MMVLGSFVEFVLTGDIGFLLADWFLTSAYVVTLLVFSDGHWCKVSERFYPWPKKYCGHCQKGEAS